MLRLAARNYLSCLLLAHRVSVHRHRVRVEVLLDLQIFVDRSAEECKDENDDCREEKHSRDQKSLSLLALAEVCLISALDRALEVVHSSDLSVLLYRRAKHLGKFPLWCLGLLYVLALVNDQLGGRVGKSEACALVCRDIERSARLDYSDLSRLALL